MDFEEDKPKHLEIHNIIQDKTTENKIIGLMGETKAIISFKEVSADQKNLNEWLKSKLIENISDKAEGSELKYEKKNGQDTDSLDKWLIKKLAPTNKKSEVDIKHREKVENAIENNNNMQKGTKEVIERKENFIERPSWRKAEQDAEKDHNEFTPQISFKRNEKGIAEMVKYGTKESVRPDLYKTGKAIEVKRYNITNPIGRYSLIRNIRTQFEKRKINLPTGTKQIFLNDTRGLTVSDDKLFKLRNEIINKVGPDIEIMFKK